jgi:hypothetical protein
MQARRKRLLVEPVHITSVSEYGFYIPYLKKALMTNLLSEKKAEALELMSSYTIPLYQQKGTQPHLLGSGFFVEHGEQHYLVSAAHVLKDHSINPLFFFTSNNQITYLSGRALLTSLDGNDPLDIGVLKFSGEDLPPYPDINKLAMKMSYLEPSLLPRQGKRYAIIGYPASQSNIDKTKREVKSIVYSYDANSIPDELYKDHGLSALKNVALPLNLNEGYDTEGMHRNFPRPRGMSGSPIWVIYDDEGIIPLGKPFPVVAIGTEFKKGIGIIGTDISVAIDLIKQAEH